MIGYHYAKNDIELNSIVYSNQSKMATYKMVWQIYKEVADSRGIYFPEEFGYAYPKPQEGFVSFNKYIVDAPDECVCCGNYDFSVYVTMARMNDIVPNFRTLPLAERLERRREAIRSRAATYFDNADPSKTELISDKWVIAT